MAVTTPNPWLQAQADEWAAPAPDAGVEASADPSAGLDVSAEAGQRRPQLVYRNVAEFVAELLAPTYRRHLTSGGGRVWCAYWWRHAEAIARLEALWRAWEHLRTPQLGGDEWLGNAIWWRDYADPCMDRLTALGGPFRHCTEEHTNRLQPLPYQPPPAGLFD